MQMSILVNVGLISMLLQVPLKQFVCSTCFYPTFWPMVPKAQHNNNILKFGKPTIKSVDKTRLCNHKEQLSCI